MSLPCREPPTVPVVDHGAARLLLHTLQLRFTSWTQEPSKPFSLWQALKDLVGKDILDAPLPIQQYCPLSELQFRAEAELEYTELFDQVHFFEGFIHCCVIICGTCAKSAVHPVQAAALPKGSIDRLLLVGACAQTGFSAGLRPFKCFNPVMGETFEVGVVRHGPVHSTCNMQQSVFSCRETHQALLTAHSGHLMYVRITHEP